MATSPIFRPGVSAESPHNPKIAKLETEHVTPCADPQEADSALGARFIAYQLYTRGEWFYLFTSCMESYFNLELPSDVLGS